MINSSKYFNRSNIPKKKVNIDKLMKAGSFVEFGSPDFMGFQLDAIPQSDGSKKTALPLPEAIRAELKAMPPGEKLVIANTSERIIPTKPIYNNKTTYVNNFLTNNIREQANKKNINEIEKPINVNYYNSFNSLSKKSPSREKFSNSLVKLPSNIVAKTAASGNIPRSQEQINSQTLVIEKQTNATITKMDKSIENIIKYLTSDLKNKKKEVALLKNEQNVRAKQAKESKILQGITTKLKDKEKGGISVKKAALLGGLGLAGLGLASGGIDAVGNVFNTIKNFVSNTFLGKLLGLQQDQNTSNDGQNESAAPAKIDINLNAPASPAAGAQAQAAAPAQAVAQTAAIPSLSTATGVSPSSPTLTSEVASISSSGGSTRSVEGNDSYGIGGPESDVQLSYSPPPYPSTVPFFPTVKSEPSISPTLQGTDVNLDASSNMIVPIETPMPGNPQDVPSMPYGHLPDAPDPDNINVYSAYITYQTNVIG